VGKIETVIGNILGMNSVFLLKDLKLRNVSFYKGKKVWGRGDYRPGDTSPSDATARNSLPTSVREYRLLVA